jgi:Na+-translocating ferredoxin:NAD+ oxidoreductase RnfC subunit
MQFSLEDVAQIQSEMLNALNDYIGVLKMPNCNSCARGLDICPEVGQPLRINCPNYRNKTEVEQATGAENVLESGVCEPAECEKPVENEVETPLNCPDDPKLVNYLKRAGK